MGAEAVVTVFENKPCRPNCVQVAFLLTSHFFSHHCWGGELRPLVPQASVLPKVNPRCQASRCAFLPWCSSGEQWVHSATALSLRDHQTVSVEQTQAWAGWVNCSRSQSQWATVVGIGVQSLCSAGQLCDAMSCLQPRLTQLLPAARWHTSLCSLLSGFHCRTVTICWYKQKAKDLFEPGRQ